MNPVFKSFFQESAKLSSNFFRKTDIFLLKLLFCAGIRNSIANPSDSVV